MFSEPEKAAIPVPELKLNVLHGRSGGGGECNNSNGDSPCLMQRSYKKANDGGKDIEEKVEEEEESQANRQRIEGKEAIDGGGKEEETEESLNRRAVKNAMNHGKEEEEAEEGDGGKIKKAENGKNEEEDWESEGGVGTRAGAKDGIRKIPKESWKGQGSQAWW